MVWINRMNFINVYICMFIILVCLEYFSSFFFIFFLFRFTANKYHVEHWQGFGEYHHRSSHQLSSSYHQSHQSIIIYSGGVRF